MSDSIYALVEKHAKENIDYTPSEPLPYYECDFSDINEHCEDEKLIGLGGVTPTSFKKGHMSWNKGIPMSPERYEALQAGRKKYQDEWHLHNVKKIRVGTWSPKADNTSALNKTTLKCPHCSKTGNYGNMKRWHFDNCGKKQTAARGKDGRWISSDSK